MIELLKEEVKRFTTPKKNRYTQCQLEGFFEAWEIQQLKIDALLKQLRDKNGTNNGTSTAQL